MDYTGTFLKERYLLIREIGRGGTGLVYLAHDTVVDRERAVKILMKSRQDNAASRKKELAFLRQLHDPGLVEIFDVVETDTALYLVMEYVDGKSLRTILDEERVLSQNRVLNIAGQLCRVLGFLHRQEPPVIYRDLKPSNVMIREPPVDTEADKDTAERVTLIDFGSARTYREDVSADTELWATRGYTAPELLEEERQSDVRCDIYSLGVLLYEMTYGERYTAGYQDNRNHHEISAMDQVIRGCTFRNPSDRFASMEEVAVALSQVQVNNVSLLRDHRRRRFFMILFLLISAASFLMSSVFRKQSLRLMEEGYSRYVENAGRATQKEEQIHDLMEAVRLNPEASDAWELLPDIYEVQGFTGEDYEQVLELLVEENQSILNSGNAQSGETLEIALRRNECCYETFAFRLGVLCWFFMEDGNGHSYAKTWLTIAKEGQNLEKGDADFAACLLEIQDCREKLARSWDLTAAEKCSLWEAVKKEAEFTQEEGKRMAVAREVATQILSYGTMFLEAGISPEELTAVLDAMVRVNPELKEAVSEGKLLWEQLL